MCVIFKLHIAFVIWIFFIVISNIILFNLVTKKFKKCTVIVFKSLHKKWSFPLRISSADVTKSARNWRNLLKFLMENFIFCAVKAILTDSGEINSINLWFNYFWNWSQKYKVVLRIYSFESVSTEAVTGYVLLKKIFLKGGS